MERAIREILADPGILGDAAESMASDADLRLAGINSMQVLQILTAIEDRFAIEVPDEVVRPETFSSIQALATAIETVAGREPSVRRDDTRFPGQSEHHSRTPAGQMSASGVVLTSSADESVHSGLRAGLAKLFAGEVGEHYTAPPVIARSISERVGYPTSFPHLLGEVHGAREGGDSGPTDLVLTSVACHHVYPLISEGARPDSGCLSVEAACFRNEATAETGRLRSFRMYEVVRWGTADEVAAWRHRALSSAEGWLRDLGLDLETTVANDPFFGSTGRYLASAQQSEELKWEMLADVADDLPQAVASVNYHKSHFGEAFGLRARDGSVGHSACVGFGLDRVTLALKQRHGGIVSAWPETVRARLGL